MGSSFVDEQPSEPPAQAETTKNSKRFRFKSERSHSHRHDGAAESSHGDKSHRHHHRRSKRRKTAHQITDDPSAYDDSASSLPPDAAFRECLFDALGDDEGAAFWQGVYGQPIHTYPKTYQDQQTGELEQMNDEEYAQYVRRKMWERSWEGIEAAKEEQRKEREREKQRVQQERDSNNSRDAPRRQPDFLFDREIEASLRRGERRRDRKRWKALWDDYCQRWDELQTLRESRSATQNEEQLFLRNKIAWPVESGKRKDVSSEQIDTFIKHCAEASDDGNAMLASILKSERVRWHPDKIQQRYGFMNIDEGTMQGVTAVFQALDQMWGAQRHRDAR